MKLPVATFLAFALAPLVALAAEKLTVTVTHDLAIARPSETISIPWVEVNKALPKALLQHLAVKDSAGRILPYQVTNVAPEAKDPKREGVAYGDLIFQHDFAAGQKSATFTVEKIEALAPVFPTKAYARFVPERLDDFAWENDKIAHRTYGPALAAPDTEKRGKEVLVTSGLDIWSKRVSYPVVDRWYNIGHDHYHEDEGEGMDMFQVGRSRGAGGTGIWDGQKLYVGRNYKTWKIVANGPVRAIFELTYEAWDAANGLKVSELKRFTVDAGHNLDEMESTFTFEGGQPLTVAIGINKNTADPGQDSKAEVAKTEAQASLAQWEVQKTNGSLGTAIVVERPAFAGFAEDTVNQLILAKVASGKPVRYFVGGGWSRAGEFTTKSSWDAYVAACAARLASPVKISLSAAK
ncbi:MAG: DUF4861 family protein [Opitutaceae bacterium]